MWDKYLRLEKKFSLAVQKHSIYLLSCSMGIVYFWFGLLKIIGMSPAEEMVFKTTHFLGIENFLIYLGVWEMIIGVCLMISRLRRIGLWLLCMHFFGVFLPLFLTPEDIFTVFPYGLTLSGQYVVKNLVYMASFFVLVGSLHDPSKKKR